MPPISADLRVRATARTRAPARGAPTIHESASQAASCIVGAGLAPPLGHRPACANLTKIITWGIRREIKYMDTLNHIKHLQCDLCGTFYAPTELVYNCPACR